MSGLSCFSFQGLIIRYLVCHFGAGELKNFHTVLEHLILAWTGQAGLHGGTDAWVLHSRGPSK